MSTEPYKQTNKDDDAIIPSSLNFKSLSRSNNDLRQRPAEIFFKHQNRNPFLKEKRNTQQDQTPLSSEHSDASDSNTGTKTPNVFASPHFRKNATRFSFKEFPKKEINNSSNLPAIQNRIASLFSENESKEITNESSIPIAEIVEKESLNQENFNLEKSLGEKVLENSNQETSINDKSKDPENPEPLTQEEPKKISSQEVFIVDNTSFRLPDPSTKRSSFSTDDNSINQKNDKDIIKKSKPLLENSSSPVIKNNAEKVFAFPGKPSSSRAQQKMRQGSHSSINDQQQKLQSNIENLYFHNETNPSNPVYSSQDMANLNKSNNNTFSTTERNNSEMKNNVDELSLIIGAVQRLKDEVVKKDHLIGEMRGQIFKLHDTLEHRERSLFNYRERIFLIESMVKRQHSYTERSKERINHIKLKHTLFKSLFCNIDKNIEEVCNQKERIEKEVDSMRLEFNKLTIKHKSILDNHAATSQTQKSQLEQSTEFNTQLNNIITQLRQDIQERDEKASRLSSELDAIQLKLEQSLSEREGERSAHAEEIRKLKLEFERIEEDNQNLIKLNKESGEKIVSLTANIERKTESTQLECVRLTSKIEEKDIRIAQLEIAEKEKDGLKVELVQTKDLAKKDLHSLKQEMEIMRTQHTIDLKRVESEYRDDHCKLQNDFHKERCHLESEWREERIRLESECREERTHRLRLEGECRDEKSERFRVETKLRCSEQTIEEISNTNDKYNLRIVQLESRLNEISRRQEDISTAAVGTTDIPGLDLQIEHNKIVSELNREIFDNKKKIEELISELNVWKSKNSSLESQLTSLNLKYEELQTEHSKSLAEIENNYLQNKEAIDQALSRAANDYEDIIKRTNVEHENEIRKLDCKIHEAETKEALLIEENQTLKSKLSETDNCNKSLQCQIQELQDSLKLSATSASEKTERNIENNDPVTPNLIPLESAEEYENSGIIQKNPEIQKNEQHYHDSRGILSLTEIDAIILESTRNISMPTNVNTQSNVNNLKTQEFNNTQYTQFMAPDSNNTLITLQETQNVTIQTRHDDNDIFDSRQNSNNVRSADDWLSPNSNLRSKRRKRGVDNSETIEQFSVQSTNISINAGMKEEPTLKTNFQGKSKVRRRLKTRRS